MRKDKVISITPKAPVLQIAPSRPVCHETVEALQRLLDEAKRGQIIGFAYVALEREHRYHGDICGAVKTSPLLSRGICRALEDTIAGR